MRLCVEETCSFVFDKRVCYIVFDINRNAVFKGLDGRPSRICGDEESRRVYNSVICGFYQWFLLVQRYQ